MKFVKVSSHKKRASTVLCVIFALIAAWVYSECRIQECRIQEIQECYICIPLLDILYVCVHSYMYNLFLIINLPTSSTLLCKDFNLYI